MNSNGQRRPYRVVFTRPGSAPADGRPGTIVAANIEIARREALHIAFSGGTAEVYYVTDTGEREAVETFRARQPAKIDPRPAESPIVRRPPG